MMTNSPSSSLWHLIQTDDDADVEGASSGGAFGTLVGASPCQSSY